MRYPLIGLAGLAAFGVFLWFCLGLYTQAFVTVAPVTLHTERAGLLMESGSAVKLNGVVVGRVGEIATKGQGATLTLDMDPAMIDRVSAGASAHIVPPTVFGSKYVDLVQPAGIPSKPLRAGSVIDQSRVTVEINSSFDETMKTLRAAPALKLNLALNAASGALDGKGKRLGELVVSLNGYLRGFNPTLPKLAQDLPRAAAAGDLFADLTPDIVRTLDNLGHTSDTLVDKRDELADLLQSVTELGNDTGDVLEHNEDDLVTTLEALVPSLRLLAEHAPELPCTLAGEVRNTELLKAVMGGPAHGGTHRGLHADVFFERSLPEYRYPADLPKVHAQSPPDCHGLPRVKGTAPYVQYDTGRIVYPHDREGTSITDPPLSVILFGQSVPTPLGRPGGGR